MKTRITFFGICALAAAFVVLQACSFSTANMSSLKTSTDKDGKNASSNFKGGDTLYAQAEIANSMSKVTVKFALTAEDVKGMTKGDAVKGTDVNVELPSSGTATYTLPIPAGVPGGTYKLTADMLNDKGEKKDSKTATITVAQTAPVVPADHKGTDKDDDDDK
jgi:hypothetical protein